MGEHLILVRKWGSWLVASKRMGKTDLIEGAQLVEAFEDRCGVPNMTLSFSFIFLI
jgi:hypothetical protein